MGAVAVLCWSFGSSLIYLGARETGAWPFVAISCLSGGTLQLISRRIYHGELRTATWLPWRLCVGPLLCFVVYGLAWPCALVASSGPQVVGVNLINYLWPVLTVVFSAWWVPGLRLTKATFIAIVLALAGLACANAPQIRELLSAGVNGSRMNQFLPYSLAVVAAVTWAIYSTLLVRWRAWSREYVTSPIGFILIGAIAGLISLCGGRGTGRLSGFGLLATIIYGIGPLAAGYLSWELALAKAKVEVLSLIAAVTPVLSTLLLCWFLRKIPGLELITAALLVSAGVALSMKLKATPAAAPEDIGIQQPRPRGSQGKVPDIS
jgi:drug/metabolite transporter (DMT)-like permease